jgi:hypothetical protein
MKLLATFLLVAVASSLDNGFTKPPMGWSALYGAPFSKVDENSTIAAAAGLAEGGLLEAGYEYVVLDDWYADRDSTGKIIAHPQTFPSGMAAVSDAVHSHGVLFGVYSAASQRTCGNWSASLFREVDDATIFAKEWKIDYLKYDSCLYNSGIKSRARYLAMSRALNATGRKIFYSVEGWSPAQGNWGPELANMWRTGNDIWPDWDACIMNNLYTTNSAASYMIPGKAFNDPDMLQPPNTIPGTTRKPGLTFEESRAQFVLWSVMKAPLMLGVHWSELATLKTSHPDYFNVITNKEIIAIDQDPSHTAVLVAQMPSNAQQQAGSILNVTYQECDPSRIDQQFVAGTKGSIQAAGSNLCLSENASSHIVYAVPCSANSPEQGFGLARDSQFHTAPATASKRCLSAMPKAGTDLLSTANCISDGKFPPPLDDHSAPQDFVWDSIIGQIVSAGCGQCVTVGQPNKPDGRWSTNNGTLEHEVWAGSLSSGKQVVVLFNKGKTAETVSAAWHLLKQPNGMPAPVRDVLAQKDLPPLAAGSPLAAQVATHGVQLFVVG